MADRTELMWQWICAWCTVPHPLVTVTVTCFVWFHDSEEMKGTRMLWFWKRFVLWRVLPIKCYTKYSAYITYLKLHAIMSGSALQAAGIFLVVLFSCRRKCGSWQPVAALGMGERGPCPGPRVSRGPRGAPRGPRGQSRPYVWVSGPQWVYWNVFVQIIFREISVKSGLFRKNGRVILHFLPWNRLGPNYRHSLTADTDNLRTWKENYWQPRTYDTQT